MNCFECTQQPPPAGLTFADRSAIGTCLRCGRGLCAEHGRYDPAAHSFLCAPCAEAPKSGANRSGRA
jgi:hypothetical protein